MVIFHSYVSLPEGKWKENGNAHNMALKWWESDGKPMNLGMNYFKTNPFN